MGLARWSTPGWPAQPDVVVTATLSKALGGAGGVVAGPAELVRHLVETGRTFIYDTALPPAVAAGVLAATDLARTGDELRAELAGRAAAAVRHLGRAGLDVSAPAAGVISVTAPGPEAAASLGRRLPGPRRRGRLLPPAVDSGQPVPAAPDGQRRGAAGGVRPGAGRDRGVCPVSDTSWRGPILVTGTDTDVGKTVVTAAITAAAQAAGLRVAVIKPGQTGTVTGAPSDIDTVNRLAAPLTARTLASFPEPLAPLAAARVAAAEPLELYAVVDAVRAEADKHDLVLIEGAGGLLVPMGVRPSGEPWTVADLAVSLGAPAVVVSRAGLGTLNHTALTLEALERRAVPAGVVLGAWPNEPELVHWANLSELVPNMVGALPDGAGAMDPGVFRRSAPGWLTPALYGVLDDWRTWADDAN